MVADCRVGSCDIPTVAVVGEGNVAVPYGLGQSESELT